MGMLVDGVWQDDVSRTKDGQFIRPIPRFRNWVTPDGSAGPTGEGGFAAESGRYHLYVSLACPWAHRTVIFRKLKGLENVVSLSVVSPDMLKDGWTFNKAEGSTGDDVNGKSKLSEIYLLTDRTWATLADGTPLVTAQRYGKGLLVLFHVTADTRWSDLDVYKRQASADADPRRCRQCH